MSRKKDKKKPKKDKKRSSKRTPATTPVILPKVAITESKEGLDEVLLDMEAFTESSLEAILRYVYTGDRVVMEQFKTDFERYVGSWTANLVRLYGTKIQMAHDMRSMVNCKYFHDVVFRLNDEVVFGHKVILMARSQYFKTLFSGNWKESGGGVVEVKAGVSTPAFVLLMEFLYTDRITFPTLDLCIEAFQLAHYYGVEALTYICSQYLIAWRHPSTLVAIWNAAQALESDSLLPKCVSYFVDHYDLVINHPSFIRLSKQNLEVALSEVYVPVTKREKMEEVLINWSKENKETVHIPPRLIRS